MARLVIPDDFISQLTLLQNIKARYDADGPNNSLTAFLTRQNINLDDDIAAGGTAFTHETNRQLLKKQSENFTQLRNNRFDPVWKNLNGSVQFLKSFYKGNEKELGNWGMTVDGKNRIAYPSPFADRAILFNTFAEKNNSYPAGESPLEPYLVQQQINLAAAVQNVVQSISDDKSASDARNQSEDETELRNNLWQPVLLHIKAIGNFLIKLNSSNPRALGAWGFVVDESPQKPKLRTTKLKLGEQITIGSILIGTALINIGEEDIHIYRGKTTTGTPLIVHADEQFGMAKGYSTITVVNPSMLKEAKFTVMASY